MTARFQKLLAGNPAIDKLAQSHLLGLIQPEDIANAALYLTSVYARALGCPLLFPRNELTLAPHFEGPWRRA